MRLEYLFTISRQGKFGSRLIAKTTGKLHPELKPCSHVVVKLGPIIVESTITKGVNIQPYQDWIKYHKVIYAFRCPEDRKAVKVLADTFSDVWGKSYDYLGICYFAWRMLGFLILNRPLPRKNRWESENRRFCVELIEKITEEKYSMTSPIQLVAKWKQIGLEEIDVSNYKLLTTI